MKPKLYGITEKKKADLERLLSHGDQLGGRASPHSPARGVTWVKVTGDPDGDGWHPALVSLDDAGEWVDQTAPVLVAAADGRGLVVRNRYMCTRTGDDPDTRKARFRAITDRPVWLARLAADNGDGTWSWGRLVAPSYTVVPGGGGTKAVPSTLDDADFAGGPSVGLRVIMWHSAAPGYTEFLPINWAADAGAGLITVHDQVLGAGDKTLPRKGYVRQSLAVNTTGHGDIAFTVYGGDVADPGPPVVLGDPVFQCGNVDGSQSAQFFSDNSHGFLAIYGQTDILYGPLTVYVGDAASGTSITLAFDTSGLAPAAFIQIGSPTLKEDVAGDYDGGLTVDQQVTTFVGFRHAAGGDTDPAAQGTLTFDGAGTWTVGVGDSSQSTIAFGLGGSITAAGGRTTVGGGVVDSPGGFGVAGVDGFTGTLGPGQTATVVGGIITNVV